MHLNTRTSVPLFLLCLCVGAPTPASAQHTDLTGLSFLTGCWAGPFAGGAGTMEEFYTSPSSNLMLGTTRYLREGQAVQFEFTKIELRDGEIVLTPFPGGVPSPDEFRLTHLAPTEAVFEAPEHDYPKRIVYRTEPDGTRVAQIDAGADDAEPRVWRLEAVPCPG